MLLHIFFTLSLIFDMVTSLSVRELSYGLYDPLTPISDVIDLGIFETHDSLLFSEQDDFTLGNPVSSVDDSASEDQILFDSSMVDWPLSYTSYPGLEENIFASVEPVDLLDEGDSALTESASSPCSGNILESLSLVGRFIDQPFEELADSAGDYCLPTKVETPVIELPELDDMYNLLNPAPTPTSSLDLLDPFLNNDKYRIICPADGHYFLLCCEKGDPVKRRECSECKVSGGKTWIVICLSDV
jgi:hypothetical protein